MTPKETSEIWKQIVSIYEETRETNPGTTVKEIINTVGFEKAKEAFATIAAIKKHDGRIYGKNREYMNSVPINPDATEWRYNNPLRYAGLDDIHTTHINQMIIELRKVDE